MSYQVKEKLKMERNFSVGLRYRKKFPELFF